MKAATPPRRILTAGRLDREADRRRDLAAVADALHHDLGLLVDAAITRARETFRAGETVREWWDRARGRPASDTGTAADPPEEPGPNRRHRRLSDHILIAFHSACDQADLETADRLIGILERIVLRRSPEGHSVRRTDLELLVAAHGRLWDLRHPEGRDQ